MSHRIRSLQSLYGPHTLVVFISFSVALMATIETLFGIDLPLVETGRWLKILTLLLVSFILVELSNIQLSGRTYGRNNEQSGGLDDRLGNLIRELSIAASAVNEIEAEIRARQTLVATLETQKEIAERTIELSSEQVDAVAAILSEQVSRQSKKDFRQELAKDMAIFILGVIVTLLVQ